MSEWIDFVIYAAQAIVLWIFMPRWSARMALPMMRDRNAAWVDAHPDTLAGVMPGAWFLKACHAWAVFTVLVLLATRLGLPTQDFLPRAAGTSGWKLLMATNSVLLSLGLLGYLGGAVVFMRWLRKVVPPSQLRQATLQPRVIDDYVPRWFRILVYVAILTHLAAWLCVGAVGRFRHPDFWPAFAGIAILTALMFVLGRASVLRRPTLMDRSSGFDYRSAEIRVAFAIQLVVVGFGVMGLCKLLYGIDLQRAGTLGFSVFFVATLYSLTRPHPGARHASTTALQ
jgi:hypothetical protein